MLVYVTSVLAVTGSILAAQLPPLKTVDEIEQQLIAAQKEVRSYSIKMDVKEHYVSSAAKTEATGTHNFEWVRKGDGFQFRMEQDTTMLKELDGQSKPSTIKLVYVYDGEFLYDLTDENGNKKARRTKYQARNPMDAATTFGQLKANVDLNVLPDATVCGRDCFGVEQVGQGMDSILGRRQEYYCKQTGIVLKSIDYDPAGEPFREMTCRELQVNSEIPDSRFVLELPPGVHYDALTSDPP